MVVVEEEEEEREDDEEEEGEDEEKRRLCGLLGVFQGPSWPTRTRAPKFEISKEG